MLAHVIIVWALFVPTFENLKDIVGFDIGLVIHRTIEVALLILFFIGSTLKNKKLERRSNGQAYFLLFFVSTLLILISLLRSIEVVIIRDIYELHKPFYFFLIFWFGFISIQYHRKAIFNWLIVFILYNQFLIFLHTYEPTTSYEFLSLYSKADNIWASRAFGVFGNPYDFGIFASLVFGFGFFNLLSRPNLIMCVVCGVGLFMVVQADSKSAILITLCVLIVSAILVRPVYVMVLSLVGIPLLSIDPTWLLEVVLSPFVYAKGLLEIGSVIENSLEPGNRLHDAMTVIGLLDEGGISSIIFGSGIMKSLYPFIEIGYFNTFLRYGFLGIILQFLILMIFVRSWLLLRFSIGNTFETAIIVVAAVIIFGNIFTVVVDQPRLSFLLVAPFGILEGYVGLFKKVRRVNPVF